MTRSWEKWWAEQADVDNFLGPHQINHLIRKRIVQETAKIGQSALDVGCATCIDYPLFKTAGIKYTGVDITEKFIEHAKKLHPGVDAKYGDAFKLPFQDSSYDSVYCKDLLEHLPPDEYKKVITEMRRVTKKLLMIAFYIPPKDKPTHYDFVASSGYYQNQYNKKEILDFLKGLVGFNGIRIVEDVGFNHSALYMIEIDKGVHPR